MGIENIKKSICETPGDIRIGETIVQILCISCLLEEEENRDCGDMLVR